MCVRAVCVVCGPDLRVVKIQFVWGGVVWVVRTAIPRDRLRRTPKISLFFFPGVSHDSPRAQTCTFEGPGASNTTKIPREDPQREKKNENGGGRGKKARNFGPPPFGPLGPHPLGPHPLGPHPLGPHPLCPHPSGLGPTFRGRTFSGFGAPPIHQAKTALTRTTHQRAKKRNNKKRTLVRNLRCPNQIGPKSAWPKLAEPKWVF